jgi:signal transduction histidine kinase
MKSLKLQFILSHVIPVVVTIPLIAIAFVYAMETHYILRDLKTTIQEQAEMMAAVFNDRADLISDPEAAQKAIKEVRPNLSSGVVLFNSDWNIIANNSSFMTDAKLMERIVPWIQSNPWDQSLEPILNVSAYNPFDRNTNIIEMVVPVTNNANQLIGVLQLSFPMTYFENQLKTASGRVIWTLIGGVILGIILGLYNATTLEKKLTKTTNAIYDLSLGINNEPLPETGPEEIVQLSKAFNTLSRKLDASEQCRMKLVSYLTHELGRPLGALSSAVDALRLGAGKDEKLADDLTTGMKSEIKRLKMIVGDLSLLREKGDPTNLYVMEPVELTPWLEEIFLYWIEVAKTREITLNAEIDSNLPTVRIDEGRLNQAISNLLNNAIKYSTKGKTVTLSATQDEEEIQIVVRDEGSGINPEDMEKIFDAFYRGNTGKRFSQGMGLGLTITRDIVEAHHGRITVESTLGEGSQFVIHLNKAELQSNPSTLNIGNNI